MPVGEILALSLESSGSLDLVKPITAKRFHDKTSAGLLVLVHERNQTKVQTVFKYVRGEAAPAFTLNQSVVLGLLMQLR